MIREGQDDRGRAIYLVGEKWFYTRAKAERAAGKAVPKAETKAEAKVEAKKPAGFLLGGGTISTTDSHVRPFAVVQVEPGKTRAFYMSTGTGGQTDAGAWNLFGGIATDGWFIKPYEGKRVAKYDAIEAALGATLGRTPDAAARALNTLPNVLHVVQASPTDAAAAAALKEQYDRLDMLALYGSGVKPVGMSNMEWFRSPEAKAYAAQRDEVARQYNALVKSFGMSYAQKLNRYLEAFKAVAPDTDMPIGYHTVRAAQRANPR